MASHIPWSQTFVRVIEQLERRFDAVDNKYQTSSANNITNSTVARDLRD